LQYGFLKIGVYLHLVTTVKLFSGILKMFSTEGDAPQFIYWEIPEGILSCLAMKDGILDNSCPVDLSEDQNKLTVPSSIRTKAHRL
jgi:hypothetical protein